MDAFPAMGGQVESVAVNLKLLTSRLQPLESRWGTMLELFKL